MSSPIPLTHRVRELMIAHEGLNQPWKVPPLETSGITIGYGYDLGHHSAELFRADWEDVLKPDHVRRLASVCGLKGRAARGAAEAFRDVRISSGQALPVFLGRSWPHYAELACKAFPALAAIAETHPDAAGAIVSLVYNRGDDVPAWTDETNPRHMRREEMTVLAAALAEGHLVRAAKVLCVMALRWKGTDAPGLVRRRIEEAELLDAQVVESDEYQAAKKALAA